MFLIKLPWRIFCYFLDGIFRVVLLAALLLLLAQHTDEVLASVKENSRRVIKKVEKADLTRVSSRMDDSLDNIRRGIEALSSMEDYLKDDGERSKKLRAEPRKAWS